MFVFGTRPEAIKMAPLVIEFRKHPTLFQTSVCVTGQHRQMLDQVLRVFGIVPEYDLNIMNSAQDLYDTTTRILSGMKNVLDDISPDLVFVHGDTTSTLAAGLAAFYRKIPVAHVEAGLRTYNLYNPWPEEINRSLTDRIAAYHFAPTPSSKKNLIDENIREENILVTGNTAIDALQWALKIISDDSEKEKEIVTYLTNEGYDINRLRIERKMILITGHRRENFGESIQQICYAIKNLSLSFPEVDFVYPVHLNPNVLRPVKSILGEGIKNRNIFLTGPLDYLPFIYLVSKSFLVLTDSGGLQEEAPWLGKPVLVMREVTERNEAMESGTAILVGTASEQIEQSVIRLLTDHRIYESMSKFNNPFGDGKASERIVGFVKNLT